MLCKDTLIRGLFVIEPERHVDERGFFARTWCADTLAAYGIDTHIAQCGTSFNHQRGTLRGLHYQAAPHGEQKLVRCTRGSIYDVVVDLRADSPTLHQWFGLELTADNQHMLCVPVGCAHGFLTLEDQSEVFYQMSHAYHPESARGVRWDDPALAIRWPQIEIAVISRQDRQWPTLDDCFRNHQDLSAC